MLDFVLSSRDIGGRSILTLGGNLVPLRHHPLRLRGKGCLPTILAGLKPTVEIGRLMIFGSKYDPYSRKFGGKGKTKKGLERTLVLVWYSHHGMRTGSWHVHWNKERSRSPGREG